MYTCDDTAQMVSIHKNHFGDTLIVTSAKQDDIEMHRAMGFVRDWMKLNQGSSLILQGFTIHQKDWIMPLFLLGEYPRYGSLYGNSQALKTWPKIKQNKILGSTVVIFLQHEKRAFWVLVKLKKYHNYFSNPGGMCETYENYKKAAKREVLEETGLNLCNPLQFVKVWNTKTYYGNLQWEYKRKTYCSIEIFPQDWVKYLSPYATDMVMNVPVLNSEIEKIVLIDVSILKKMDGKNELRKTINVGEIHLNLARLALRKCGEELAF